MKLAARALAIEPTLIRQITNRAGPASLHLGLGQPDLPLPQAARDALAAAERVPYTPNRGLPDLVSKIEARYRDEFGAIVTCGVQEALAVAMLGLVDGGDVLVPDPGFPAYPNLVRAAGAKPVPYALGDRFALDADLVAEAWTEDTVAIVLNSPSNPTGAVAGAEATERVVRWAEKHDAFWISDEIYEDFVWDGRHISPSEFGANGVVASGLSKSHAAMGLRIGWITGPAQTLDSLVPLHQHLVTCAAEPAQRAALALLAVHGELVADVRRVFEARRDLTIRAIADWPDVPLVHCEGAFYAFVDVRAHLEEGDSSLDLALELLDTVDVVTIPGIGFGERGEGYLRLAYTVEETILTEALGRVGDHLKNRSSG